MHSAENTEASVRLQRFLARANLRAALPYLAVGLLLIVAIVGGGREIDITSMLSSHGSRSLARGACSPSSDCSFWRRRFCCPTRCCASSRVLYLVWAGVPQRFWRAV